MVQFIITQNWHEIKKILNLKWENTKKILIHLHHLIISQKTITEPVSNARHSVGQGIQLEKMNTQVFALAKLTVQARKDEK